ADTAHATARAGRKTACRAPYCRRGPDDHAERPSHRQHRYPRPRAGTHSRHASRHRASVMHATTSSRRWSTLEGMLKVDVHSHILPADWPDLARKYGDNRFPVMTHSGGHNRIYKDGKFFREVWDTAFDPVTRIEEYRQHGVDVQVISTVPVLFSYWAPGSQALDLHRHLNDHTAGVCRDHPRNVIGLGTVPLQSPTLAIQELERCIEQLDLAGVQVGSHCNQWNLDAPELFPFFEAAAELGAAIMVHPWDM